MLRRYAAMYESASFLDGDPSWFMHQVVGAENQEAMAFVASCLSYGSRKQFMPKIHWLLDRAGGNVDKWVRTGGFAEDLPEDDPSCYYRLFTVGQMHLFLQAYRLANASACSCGGWCAATRLWIWACGQTLSTAVHSLCR